MPLKNIIFVSALLTFGTAPAFAVSDQKAEAAFKQADKNADSSLNRPEFEAFIRQMAMLGNPNAARAVRFGFVGFRVAFNDADANGDGAVTARELQKIR